VMYLDQIRFYNDSAVVDVSGDLNATAPVGTAFYLKFGGSTIATGYYTGTATAGTVTIIPDALISVGGTSIPFDLYTSTTALMHADASGVTEVLSLSMDMGTPAAAGDFRWSDQDYSGSIIWINPVSGITSVSAGY